LQRLLRMGESILLNKYTPTQRVAYAYNLAYLPHENGIIFKQCCNRPKTKPIYFQLVSCCYRVFKSLLRISLPMKCEEV
jgi:hypothetical protein